MTATHAYTDDMNHMYILPSGNWFTGFVANIKTHTVYFNYCDRRRNGQVARRYIVRFEKDCSTVKDIVAISANGGRVEMFKSTVARETCSNILRRGILAKEEKTMTTIIVNTLVDKMGIVVSVFALIAFIVTLCFFFFGEASAVDTIMKALIGAEGGALVALSLVGIAMDVKHSK